MDSETIKAINNISKRLNQVEQKLEQFLLGKQEISNKGIAELASIINTQDEAIADLAQTVSEITQNNK